MSKIFYFLNLLVFIISEEIIQWNCTDDNLFFTSEGIATSLVSVPTSTTSYYIFIYKNNKEELFYSTEPELTWESKNVTLSPYSINLDNIRYIIFSENDQKFYYFRRIGILTTKLVSNEISEVQNFLSLKGSGFTHNTDYFLIAFIGTNKAYSYDYSILTSKVSINKRFSFDFNIINIFIPSSSEYDYDYDYIYIYSYINETVTELSKYRFLGTSIDKVFSLILPVKKLYSITEISKAIGEKNSFLIFSYNKNEEDFYFYNFNYTNTSNIELTNFGNKYNFWPFRDAKILNAFFLKNTEYLYYLIIKDGIYNAGVLDVFNNLIIFNTKKKYIEFISIDNTTLIYGANTTVYTVCPFKSPSTGKCPKTLNNASIIVTTTKFENKVYSYMFCSMSNVLNRLCLYYIPLGYYAILNKTVGYFNLVKCVFNIDKLVCVDKCEDNEVYDSVNKVCYSCGHFNQFKNYDLDECIDDCSIYGLYSDPRTGTCRKCSYGGYYLQNDKCVKKCDDNYVVDEVSHYCINCKDDTVDTPFYQDNECVDTCKKYYMKDDISCYNCTKRYGDEYYFFNHSCTNSCPKYSIKDDSLKICYLCEERYTKYLYYEEGKCLLDCDDFFIKDTQKKICIRCTEINPNSYFQDNKCVEKCDEYSAVDNKTKICINCYKYNLTYLQDNKCVEKCDTNFLTDDINHVCYQCKDINPEKPYLENNVCKENCSNYFARDDKKFMCTNCSNTSNEYYQDNTCVQECNVGYSINDSPVKHCQNCYDLNKLYEYEGKCVSKCPENTIPHSYPYYCSACNNGTFLDLFNKKCVEKCEEQSEINNDAKTCKKCLYFNLIYNNITKNCVEKCLNGTFYSNGVCEKCDIYDDINQICIQNCPKGKYPFYLENKNSSSCFNCFCGFGNCISNDNYKLNKDIEKSYSCQCGNNENQNFSVFGKNCQYKTYFKENQILTIRPLQETAHINQKNIFTFEFLDINDSGNSSHLRRLSTRHEELLKRRIKYKIEWFLNDNINSVVENNMFYEVEPNTLKDNEDNKIKLKIYDLENNEISESELIIRLKSINIENFEITFKNHSNFIPMKESSSPKILINEKGENNNYILNYKYISKDEEEFSLTGYIRNNFKTNEFLIPYSSKMKIEIKNDYNDIISIEEDIYFNNKYTYNKTLSSILEIYENENSTINVRNLINEIKTFFNETKNFEYSKEEKNIYLIFNITEKYLPLAIEYEDSQKSNRTLNISDINQIIEPNYFISLLNQIAIFIYNYEEEIYNENEIYIKIIEIIHDSINNNEINSLKEETIISLFRTIDNLLTILNKLSYMKYDYSGLLFNDINLLKDWILIYFISGNDQRISGKNFNITLVRLNYYSEVLYIDENRYTAQKDDFLKYSNYKMKSDTENSNSIKKKCSSSSIFCINNLAYDYICDELSYLKNEKISNIVISLTQLNNNNNAFALKWNKLMNNENNKRFLLEEEKNNERNSIPENLLNYSYDIEIRSPINRKTYNDLKNLRYNVSFDFPSNYQKNKSDITCVAMNSLIKDNKDIKISNEENCLTYFDLENEKIICECNTKGEVLILLDKKLANLSKKIQFSNKKYKIINCISGSIILSSLALIAIFSVILIYYDFLEDKFNSIYALEKVNTKVKYEYKTFRFLKNSSVLTFSLYLTYYKYSFLNIFSTYKFDHPRYIRFFIEIIKILLNLLLSAYPFYNTSFKEKKEIINERSAQNQKDFKLLRLNDREPIRSFVYSLIASIIIWFIVQLVVKILEFKKIRSLIWNPKKNILKEYTYEHIKKCPNFKKKFKKIKKLMLAYAKVCGKSILSKKDVDKYSLYLEYKSAYNKKLNMLCNSNIGKTSSKYNNIELDLVEGSNLLPLQENIINTNEKDTSLSNISNLNINNINNSLDSFNGNRKEKLKIEEASKFFIMPSKITEQISMKSLHKFESIKLKYLINEEKMGDGSSRHDTNVIKYVDLDIDSQKNYSYIPSNKLSKNTITSTSNKSKLCMTILVNIILFFTLIIIDMFILIVFNNIYEEYEERIISSWLLPVIFQITIFNFIINYLFALLSTILLFNFYGKRKKKNCFVFIFNLFVEKYMIYFYKIRAFINKYNYHFKHI